MALISQLHMVDIAIFHFFTNMSAKFPALMPLAIFLAGKLIYIIPIHLLFMFFCGPKHMKSHAIVILLAVISALFLSFLIGIIYDRPRPYLVGLSNNLLNHRNSPSFPSNHAIIFSIYIYFLYLYRYKLMFFVALIFGLLTFLFRIITGTHYPFDIISGVIIGLMVAALFRHFLWPLIWQKWGHKFCRLIVR